MQHWGLLQALQPARWRFEAGAPVEMNVGHLHQAVGVCGRLPAHQFEHQLADGVQGNLVDLGRLGEQCEIERALQQLATEVLARRCLEAHRETGGQGIDVVEPVIEVELPEHRGCTYGELLTETGGEGHVLPGAA